MTKKITSRPNYIFETSWEICNKIGGIYTVLSTKAPLLQSEFGDHYISIGPDVWKETRNNPDFIEDRTLLSAWREKMATENLHCRIGRWNIEDTPLAILVDFTTFFAEKDKIFFHLWEKYKVDSLSGNWDYIEPALFGIAAGKVIESFYSFYLSPSDRVVAHFHEWMTGTGVLYLHEHSPQVGTVFTTHATTIGRSIAGNGLPLYTSLLAYHGEDMARQFGIISKFTLERSTAANTDAFTAVSAITADEAGHLLGKKVDAVTPNGFSASLLTDKGSFDEKRDAARTRLLDVAGSLFGEKLPDDTFLIITSGRYEFRNKGINLFIDALGKFGHKNPDKPILAFVMVPANHTGPSQDLIERMDSPEDDKPTLHQFLTHDLYDPGHDAILGKIRENNIMNEPGDKVRVIFVPAYLNGTDGIFNLTYYQLLPGFDLSVFPSYYEPWGYTPLESIAFGVPTLSTTQAGFGKWVTLTFPGNHPSVRVVNRSDDNDKEVISEIAETIETCLTLSPAELDKVRENAFEVASKARWDLFIEAYWHAYGIALKKSEARVGTMPAKFIVEKKVPLTEAPFQDIPVWKRIIIEPSIPVKLKGLQELSRNLWWSWNFKATEMFESIDPVKWKEFSHNPILLLDSLNIYQWRALEADTVFHERYLETYLKYQKYIEESKNKPSGMVAYFSMEFGLHQSLKIYSGGLGILAGDYLKECSDSNENIVAIGIIYRHGYFQQSISLFGDQVADYQSQNFSQLPISKVLDDDGHQMKIRIGLPGRTLYVRVWRADVGRIPLYLLDTDFDENADFDRRITHQLYGGDWENRLKQEMVLGVGGIRLLHALGLNPAVYHINEGHAAFIGLERLRHYIQEHKYSYKQAFEIVRSTSLFTTHTPVPAGHDTFSEDLMRTYFPHYAERLNISWDEFMNLGKFTENDPNEKFSMSVLAAKLSQEINGVSRIHGRVSQEMFARLFDGYYPGETQVGYVTNGVHLPTWASKQWKLMYKKTFGEDYKWKQLDWEMWKKIHQVGDGDIWKTRKILKKELLDYVRDRLRNEMTRRQENPKLVINTLEAISDDALVVGFARRFATYKRAKLMFTNLDRLSSILNIIGKPLLFIYAGKAHPNDGAGQELIKRIMEISRSKEFIGKVVFIENYDMDLAHKLIPGVDIWMNTPTRPLEASGTSGEKAVMNGVVNLSVLDGWWAEGYRENAGFAVQEARTYANQQFQDELDAEVIYNLFEDEILPLFFERDADGIPIRWIQYIKNTISEIAPHFTMKRMLEDYKKQYYNKLITRSGIIHDDNARAAAEYAAWKQEMLAKWHEIKLEKLMVPDSSGPPLTLEDVFSTEVTIYTNGISPEHLGVEIVFGRKEGGHVSKISFSKQMELVSVYGKSATYAIDVPAYQAGSFNYAFRIFPKHELMPHRQDFSLVKWV